MKISRNTPDQLILDITPWLWGLMVALFLVTFAGLTITSLVQGSFGVGFVAVLGTMLGLLAFGAFVQRVQLILDRAANTLVIRRRSLRGYSQVEHNLSDVQRADLDITAGGKGGTMKRAVLVFDQGMSEGRHPITDSYTNTSEPDRIVTAINDWLAATAPQA